MENNGKNNEQDEFFMDIIEQQRNRSRQAEQNIRKKEDNKKTQIIKRETEDKVKELYILKALSKVKDNTIKIKFNTSDNIYLFRTKKPRIFIEEVVKALMDKDKPKQEWLQVERKEKGGAFTIEEVINYVQFF